MEHISCKGAGVPISWFPVPEESCLIAHGAAPREALGAPILADGITLDHRRAGLDERRTAILDFAVKITERPLTPEDLERSRASA